MAPVVGIAFVIIALTKDSSCLAIITHIDL
jgi:hypothetical protein